MIRSFLAVAGLSLLALVSVEAKSGWLTDLKRAQEQAKTEKKLLLLDFTGSDWCGWCIALDKEVFSKPEFREYARKNLVLMEVDFPRGKRQARVLQAQNETLAAEYGIQGYPTIIILDSEGKKLATLGYMEGGPKAFIAELEKLRNSSAPVS